MTKTWSQKEFPLIEVGELELNRNPLNYFAEVEQAAFGPSNMVPGSACRRTACCKVVYSPTQMRTATVWVPITSSCR